MTRHMTLRFFITWNEEIIKFGITSMVHEIQMSDKPRRPVSLKTLRGPGRAEQLRAVVELPSQESREKVNKKLNCMTVKSVYGAWKITFSSVTLLDYKLVTELDFCSQFFVPQNALGKNRAEASEKRAQALNPMVEVKVDIGNFAKMSDEYFKDFDVVCISEGKTEDLVPSVKFFAFDLWGMFGYSFADLKEHEFAIVLMGIPCSKFCKSSVMKMVVIHLQLLEMKIPRSSLITDADKSVTDEANTEHDEKLD
uniref:CSON003510 protein n=1 Tax=Culicoides sonorensis TaxID=179676 RepID=A0A336LVJ4_CULSO